MNANEKMEWKRIITEAVRDALRESKPTPPAASMAYAVDICPKCKNPWTVYGCEPAKCHANICALSPPQDKPSGRDKRCDLPSHCSLPPFKASECNKEWPRVQRSLRLDMTCSCCKQATYTLTTLESLPHSPLCDNCKDWLLTTFNPLHFASVEYKAQDKPRCESCRWWNALRHSAGSGVCQEKQSPTHGKTLPFDFGCVKQEGK